MKKAKGKDAKFSQMTPLTESNKRRISQLRESPPRRKSAPSAEPPKKKKKILLLVESQ